MAELEAPSQPVAADEVDSPQNKTGRLMPAKSSSIVLELLDPQNKEQILTSPFSEALKAQEEVDEKVTGLVHRHHHYIPRKKPGEITREHEQYNLTYAMMIGIRHSVTSWQEENAHISNKHRTLEKVAVREMKKGVEDAHFFDTYKTYFPPEGGQSEDDPLLRTPPHLLKTGFKFKDYAPAVFARLRKRFEIDDLDYLTSLCGSFNYLEFISNSKSGEFFFYSHDGRFLIKTQRKSESHFMRKILPKYYNYVADNPNSLLVRICGAHRVKLPHLQRKMHFVIMMSVFADATEARPVNKIYDLKGATAGRRAKPGENVKKDLDVLDDKQVFHLGPKRRDFMAQVERDSKFLASLGVMDYSLLVGIHERETAKPLGSWLFRSDRKSSLQDAALDIARKESPRELEFPSSPTSRKTPSLPTTFSRQQILNGGGDGVFATHAPPSPKPTRSNQSLKATYSDTSLANLVPPGLSSGLRFGSTETFNSFYKMESRDEGGHATGETYHVGIIDIFTRYSAKKRGEHLYKSLQGNGSTVSAVNPRQYQQRFVKFISNLAVDN